ncbi:MAG: FAD-dependent oxidoreductase [Nitrosomonas sp.]|uniref:FAD-dependent oxidoreductase n=1 Tax=Nitrosomonas sp. TaxID=42353 RepID=UPI002733B95C|nr:FAD-dependent oxidoreductase [Nitrosomonas sp.]MDP1935417.1 FAD-dependent oxidoreductase [Nitrosomonas sp.]MDP3279555.1 FAD-dependent oxidoreductase [Nitrosomonas sp.]MDP3662131.1 FAD-dependent oxidoreductase [Nitrosomonas sp.]MDZ4106179.1 FAD-dependent oxidoreductase [Nitrosomonas sp.]
MGNPVIIVGSGLAGYAVARELRKLNAEIPIVMISADHGGFYSKPMLSNALSTGKTPESILNGDAVQMASQLKITIRSHCRVTAIDQPGCAVILVGGEKIFYDQLVLALGADQVSLTLSGDGVAKILTVNDLDDYKKFRDALAGKKRVSIIGAGLIGCEFANDLATTGYHVDVIDISAQPLGRLLPSEGGSFIRQKLEESGVVFHLNASTQSIDQVRERLCITFANDASIETDIVLSAVGLRPRTQLAAAAGIPVNRGILVNRLLQTQFSNIYALGDCAEVEGKVLPFVMPITHAARALAATLSGNPTPVLYPAMPVIVKTPACSTVVSPPDFSIQGEWHVDADKDGVKALYRDETGNLLGYALLGAATKEKNNLTAQLPPVLM